MSSFSLGGLGVGTKLRPLERTDAAASESGRLERLVMCLRSLSLLILL